MADESAKLPPGPADPVEIEKLRATCEAALAQTSGELRVRGLREPVEVLRDPWGVPHIYARNARDLFRAQGFVQAQDRLWQMEIWRREAEGRLAEIGGPAWVERDKLARLIRYRGDPEAEWASYGPDARQIAESFVGGINAFIEQASDRLPIEFQLLGVKPEAWTPEVCLGRMAGFVMCRNAATEALRALLLREVGPEETAKLLLTDPRKRLDTIEGFETSGIDDGLLQLLVSVNAPLHIPFRGSDSDASVPDLASSEGSNNWAVAGRRSATHMPWLANDPHRLITVPSLRYVVHLVCPPDGPTRGWNVIGGCEPAIPGVTIGHNDRIAWGFTVVNTDQQDLYVEETHPDDPSLYRVGGEWMPMQVEHEALTVLGEREPRILELKFTRHGPVIHQDPERQRAIALRWTGAEPGGAGYLASLALDRARDWREFIEGAASWNVPGCNLVYADLGGHIGWIAAALTPVRPGWDGLLPVPGWSGEYEWRGWLSVSELPQTLDPDAGFIATANQNILPADYPHAITFDWSAPFRFQRIEEVLKDSLRCDAELSKRLQHDATSIPARQLIALLRRIPIGDETLRGLAELLFAWDNVLDRNSAAAAFYEAWKAQLVEAVIRPRVPPRLWPIYSVRSPIEPLLELMQHPDSRFGPDPVAGRDSALVDALRAAASELRSRLGNDPAGWKWGSLHQAHFRHMISPAGARPGNETRSESARPFPAAAVAAVLDLPSVPRDGDSETPLATSGVGFDQTSGASYCHIIDLSNWDRSVAKNAPGQSGQPGSPHYDDLLEPWGAGEYFPLLYSREAVVSTARHKLILLPSDI